MGVVNPTAAIRNKANRRRVKNQRPNPDRSAAEAMIIFFPSDMMIG
jgi:hypothetical protein